MILLVNNLKAEPERVNGSQLRNLLPIQSQIRSKQVPRFHDLHGIEPGAGTDTELYAERFRKGQAIVVASTAMTDGDAFFELFRQTSSYKKLAGLTRGQRRFVSDEQLIECLTSFIAIANPFSPANPVRAITHPAFSRRGPGRLRYRYQPAPPVWCGFAPRKGDPRPADGLPIRFGSGRPEKEGAGLPMDRTIGKAARRRAVEHYRSMDLKYSISSSRCCPSVRRFGPWPLWDSPPAAPRSARAAGSRIRSPARSPAPKGLRRGRKSRRWD